MTLPATPDPKFLKKWADLGEEDGFNGQATFSNPNVQVVFIDFFDAYNAAGNPVDYLLLSTTWKPVPSAGGIKYMLTET